MKTKVAFTLLAIMVFMFCTAPFALSQDIGSNAPDFTLKSLDDDNFKLSDHTGKVIMVYFLGNGCPYCKSAGPKIQSDIYEKYKDNDNFVAVGVDTWDDTSTKENLTDFKEVSKLTFTLLLKGKSVSQEYGTTYDRLMVISKEGKIAYKKNTAAINTIEEVYEAIGEELSVVTSIDNGSDREQLSIYPNPFSDKLTINFSVQKNAEIKLFLYDITGKTVKTIFDGNLDTGNYSFQVFRDNLKAGVYFVGIQINESIASSKVIIIENQ